MTTATQVNLGLAEFIEQLVRETFTSVVGVQIEQERRLQEVVDAAADDAAALKLIADPDIERELRLRLPGHDIDEGAKYVPAGKGVEEAPPFAAELGLELTPTDVAVKNGARVLTKAGVARIRAHVQQQLAQRAGDAARRLIEQGAPKVRVTSGRIVAKVGLDTITTSDKPPPDIVRLDDLAPPKNDVQKQGDSPTVISRQTLLVRSLCDVVRPRLASDDPGGLRIVVSSTNRSEPERPQQAVGEIELSFSTVLP